MAFLGTTKETQPAGSNPEQAAVDSRSAVVGKAVDLAMGATFQYVDYVAPSEATVAGAANRFAPVNIAPMVNPGAGQQEQMAA
jgi:hypothetical protein